MIRHATAATLLLAAFGLGFAVGTAIGAAL